MPSTRRQRALTRLRLSTPWRRALGDRTVRRTVQGVQLYLPWSHPLPDYARSRPTYGQNLVELAASLDARLPADHRPMQVLDVGANIGDSARQILARVDARLVCVEPDPYWLHYLRRNVGHDSRVAIEPALLTAESGQWAESRLVRHAGTTQFVSDPQEEAGANGITVADLRRRHPDLDRLRLVKSDTDGFDPVLVRAIAQGWRDVRPVLFFEFDPTLARACDPTDPALLWQTLEELGYRRIAIWDNAGDPLGQLDVSDAAAAATILEPRPRHLGYHFWDVAACTDDDTDACASLDQLMPMSYATALAAH